MHQREIAATVTIFVLYSAAGIAAWALLVRRIWKWSCRE